MNDVEEKPIWADMAHHEKYLLLNRNREKRCQNGQQSADISGEEYFLNGKFVQDVPSFYLALGEAINGNNGYYGTCLLSLDDCLLRGFGAVPPFTIHIIEADGLEDRLDEMAWVRYFLEHKLSCFEKEEPKEQLIEWGVCDAIELNGNSFFKAICNLFEERNAELKVYD